jgi:two-component system invasion response regulator UvrY
MTRILVCDDHPVVREGLREILTAIEHVEKVGEASDAGELFDAVRAQRWDAVVLDIGLPGLSGLDALRQLKQERPRLPVLVLSVYPADQFAVRVLRAGASGYLTKDAAAQELVKAVLAVAAGHKYVTSDVAEQLASELERPDDRPSHERLSDREYQVLCLLGSGRTVTRCAEDLSLSVKTVSTHRANILRKLALQSTAEVIRYAIEHRLVPMSPRPPFAESRSIGSSPMRSSSATPTEESDTAR